MRALALPRIIACTVITGLLGIVALCFGLLGGFIAAVPLLGANPWAFYNSLFANLTTPGIWGSVVKTTLFGLIIGVVCCYEGMYAKGGAIGVGRAVNQAVVIAFALIWVVNVVFTSIVARAQPRDPGLQVGRRRRGRRPGADRPPREHRRRDPRRRRRSRRRRPGRPAPSADGGADRGDVERLAGRADQGRRHPLPGGVPADGSLRRDGLGPARRRGDGAPAVSSMLDALTCLAIAVVLVALGTWGRSHADSLVVDTIQGEEREQRIAVLRRGAITCHVVAGVLGVAAFFLIATR